jgi:acetyl esterase/lipase
MPENVRPLWATPAPNALGDTPEDVPTLTEFLPAEDKATGASMLVLPGGGYGHLAAHEGEGYARWLAANGIASYVLKYRLGTRGYRHPTMLLDAARGLRLVRHIGRDQHRDTHRVGVIGSSAGGHLAATLVTHFDAGQSDAADPVDGESSRPDLGILCYPVITMGAYTHQGSKQNLLGDHPSDELVKLLSNELQVTPNTPPCFLWHTSDDPVVPVENSLAFGKALHAAGVRFDLHVFEHGRHGLGLGTPKEPAPPWADLCLYWLRKYKFVA